MSETRARRSPSAQQLLEAKRIAHELAQRLKNDGYGDDYPLLVDTLEGQTTVLETVDRIVDAREQAKVDAEGLKRRIADMQVRKAKFERLQERLTVAAQEIMEAGGLASPGNPLRRDFFTGSIGPGPRHVIPTKDAKDMEPRYQRVTIEPNLKELGEALAAHEADVPAVWSNSRNILRILTK